MVIRKPIHTHPCTEPPPTVPLSWHPCIDNYPEWETYVQLMSRDTTYAEQPQLLAIATIYQLRIHLYSTHEYPTIIPIGSEYRNTRNPTLCRFHHQHFSSRTNTSRPDNDSSNGTSTAYHKLFISYVILHPTYFTNRQRSSTTWYLSQSNAYNNFPTSRLMTYQHTNYMSYIRITGFYPTN